MAIIIETDQARIEIERGSAVSVNGVGDKVVQGYRTDEDIKKGKAGLAMMALVPQDRVRYLYFDGDCKVTPRSGGRSGAKRD